VRVHLALQSQRNDRKVTFHDVVTIFESTADDSFIHPSVDIACDSDVSLRCTICNVSDDSAHTRSLPSKISDAEILADVPGSKL